MRGVESGFAGAVDHDGLLSLVVEVNVEDGVAAGVPYRFGDGEVEEDHAFGGLAGGDHGFAEEGIGDEGFEFGEVGVDGVKVSLFGGAGGELLAIGGGEGGGEVLEEEGKVEAIVDVEGGEDVEVVLSLIVADDGTVGLEDGVGGDDDGASDGEIGGPARGFADDQGDDDAHDQKRYQNRGQEVAANGLGEGELGHVGQGLWIKGICSRNVTKGLKLIHCTRKQAIMVEKLLSEAGVWFGRGSMS